MLWQWVAVDAVWQIQINKFSAHEKAILCVGHVMALEAFKANLNGRENDAVWWNYKKKYCLLTTREKKF